MICPRSEPYGRPRAQHITRKWNVGWNLLPEPVLTTSTTKHGKHRPSVTRVDFLNPTRPIRDRHSQRSWARRAHDPHSGNATGRT